VAHPFFFLPVSASVRCPVLAIFGKGGYDAACIMRFRRLETGAAGCIATHSRKGRENGAPISVLVPPRSKSKAWATRPELQFAGEALPEAGFDQGSWPNSPLAVRFS
jgi:hypothetical protein